MSGKKDSIRLYPNGKPPVTILKFDANWEPKRSSKRNVIPPYRRFNYFDKTRAGLDVEMLSPHILGPGEYQAYHPWKGEYVIIRPHPRFQPKYPKTVETANWVTHYVSRDIIYSYPKPQNTMEENVETPVVEETPEVEAAPAEETPAEAPAEDAAA